MNKLLTLVAAGVSLAGGAFACNPWVSPTDTACAGMVVSVTPSAQIAFPVLSTVTPSTAIGVGAIAWNTSGTQCFISTTTWTKSGTSSTACGFGAGSN